MKPGTDLSPLPWITAAGGTARRRNPLVAVLGVLVLVAAGGLFGAWIASFAEVKSSGWDLSRLEKLGLVLACVPVIFLFLAAHEAGHLLGGRLAGFRFMLFIVGPLKIHRERDRIRLGLNRNAGLVGGLAACMPEDPRDLRRRTLTMVAGGPLASLVTGAFALGLFFGLDLQSLPPESGLAALYGSVALLMYGGGSLTIGVVTLIPGRTSGFLTDGARILQLLRGGPRAERDVALMALIASSQAGLRPRDWDGAIVEQTLLLEDGSLFEALARMLVSARALDLGDPESARRHLERALALAGELPPTVRPGLLLEAAWFEAAIRGDAEAGRRWLEAAGEGALVQKHARLRAGAAVLASEGKPVEAAELATQARDLLRQDLDAGGAAAQIEWLEELLESRPEERRAVGA
jgi:hypothetical protein